eukprot:CAMPEP_0172900542 /NCGR_PEP_ID=MMETSP1075-20121228/164342_1 /TAXON_ID=2916 /ORGANISM="Ceratium fusus, Strain PA161109" /LENGTH=134 /DNA_ID=CAMNT_0013756745 /DNA_START=8 /DNA_END=413 /DNA_ORIENTATION=+
METDGDESMFISAGQNLALLPLSSGLARNPANVTSSPVMGSCQTFGLFVFDNAPSTRFVLGCNISEPNAVLAPCFDTDAFQRTWLALHVRLGSLASACASFLAISFQKEWLLYGSSFEHFISSTLQPGAGLKNE